ncbi:MAG: DNA polymerase I [Pseudomonadales bacterium]|jgi:DNA polymerase-1|nr:DNA polymerase I [Pseudomonadales bacterium]MDP6471448.1 DNA polymerase I [Pseudomonadales bacterium]MDP6828617.1 DNA polymerase I [Pseudomonadales bacterium]MDP6972336.1 DNA polymerase I [Pseudomonadales bacterium]
MSSVDQSKPVVLVDGSSYLFRAYYALPELSTSDGHPTGAVRGVIAMIRKLAKDYAGSPIAVVFDASGKTFRDQLYSEYKANRPPMPDDLRQQIQPIHDIIRAMGLPLLVVPGVEADDVIGTLAHEATRLARDTVVSTGDKDMAQLVSDHVTLVNTMTDVVTDRAGVHEKYGVAPEQIIDYLALMGDAVDNIPGVPKVGPKTAAKWLGQYGSLDEVIAHADEIKGKVGESLRDALEQLPLSRELTTIKSDVQLETGIEALLPTEPLLDDLRELFERFEFRRWSEELGGSVAATMPDVVSARDYECVLDEARLDAWIEKLASADLFAFDTETTSLDYMQAELVGVSFSVATGSGAYVPCGHFYAGAPAQLSRETVLERLRPLLESPQIAKVGQNLKYDTSVLARHGVTLRGIAFDTMLESYVLDSVGVRHNMDAMAEKFLGRATLHFEDIAGKGVKQLTFDQIGLDIAADYAAEDADVTLQLHECLWPRLQAESRLRSVFEDIEMPLLDILSRVERHGTLVDGGALEEQGRELETRMVQLTHSAHALAGESFNLDSPKQLRRIFFEVLDLPVLKKTPKGQPSTAERVLVDLARDYELPEVILEYRGLAKLKSTYTDKLPLQINQASGRIHTSYHQAVAATGRLSSSDPNLQNIPIRTAEGRRIRQAFVAPQGMRLVAADYSQIELRIMAHLSGDVGLNAAFADNQDIHRATASEVFGVDLDAVSDDQRRSAKAINFGLIYGMSAFGLGRQLGISRTLAQDYIDRYFNRYPGVQAYMEATRALAREQGYVETVFGRRLYVPEINARHMQRRQAAERTAINAPMQGTAADIIKRAMIAVEGWLEAGSLDAAMIMQVHDELVFEVAEADVAVLVEGVKRLMVDAAALEVALVVDAGIGANWDEAH